MKISLAKYDLTEGDKVRIKGLPNNPYTILCSDDEWYMKSAKNMYTEIGMLINEEWKKINEEMK